MNNTVDSENKKIHLGKNTQRVREIVGMKQETLAIKTGYSQQYISKLEQSTSFADDVLLKISEAMGVTPDLIKNFEEEKTIYNIQSNITYHDSSVNSSGSYKPNIYNSPMDQIMTLFEKLLVSEKEKVKLLTEANKAIQQLNNQIKELSKKR